MRSIKEVLMTRDGITADEAEARIAQARLELLEALDRGNLVDAEDICLEHFGLEPDYLDELLDGLT